MKMRAAILAACASTLVMTATLALAGDPIPGVDAKLGSGGKNAGARQIIPAVQKQREAGARSELPKSGGAKSPIADQGQGGVLTSNKNKK